MALAAILESLDELRDDLRTEYKPVKIKDASGADKEVFVLDVTGVREHPEVTGLKTAFEKQKEHNKKLKSDLDAANAKLKDYPEDFDKDEWDRLKALDADPDHDPNDPEKKKERDKQLAGARKALEEKIKRLEEKHTKDLADKDEIISKKDGVIQRLLVSDGLSKALDEAGVDPDLKDGAIAILRNAVKVVEEDGEPKAIAETDMGPTELAKHVADWLGSDKGRKYVKPATGSSANGGKPPMNGENPWHKDSRNLTKQQEIVASNPERAKALAKAAGAPVNW